MGSLQSSVLGFGVFRALQRFAPNFTPLENVVLQTVAVATATMPLAAGAAATAARAHAAPHSCMPAVACVQGSWGSFRLWQRWKRAVWTFRWCSWVHGRLVLHFSGCVGCAMRNRSLCTHSGAVIEW